MKQTPKSCSCSQCKRGKHTSVGHKLRNADEKSLRQKTRIMLAKGEYEDITPAPIGNYYD